MTRTHDLLITNQLLYRLSYASNFCRFLGSLCILSRCAAVVNRNCRYFAPGLRLFRLFGGLDAHHGVKVEPELAADGAKLRERGVVDGDAVFELFIAGVDLHFAGGVNAGAAFGLGAAAQLLQKRRKALAHRGLVAEHAVIERKIPAISVDNGSAT